ncbi:hypothetical protein [Roseobacter sp. AzwK-3b]|uniref:hypothetical protein n=1 Tax=Roseobacter sp. AzwK-3b TaxID=351016 RepID=UPI0012F4A003|nr:hypothetical protein [Roseobacter sp. AzwK-3b]
MSEAAERIPLTAALTLAAFGVEVPGERFAKALNAQHFGLTRTEAFTTFNATLKSLLQRVSAGDLALLGKFVPEDGPDGSEVIAPIAPHTAESFAAFDYRIDGLRFGPPSLLWFSFTDEPYTTPHFARSDHYRDITMIRGQLRKFLGTGNSPYRQETKRPTLPDANLKAWWGSLSEEQRLLPRNKLLAMAVNDHPNHKVTRQRIRELGPRRKAGRPKSAKKKTAN